MNTQEFVEAFQAMSAENQATIREAILGKKEEPGCCTGPEMDNLKKMFGQMEKSDNPMAMCFEMMRLCQEKMASKTCA